MATTTYLRDTVTNEVNVHAGYKDLLTSAGAANVAATANTVASGTEILLDSWISRPFPAGGVANLGTITLNLYGMESNLNANCTFGARCYRRTPAGVESELLAAGRQNDDVEFPATSASLMSWIFTPNQNRAFAEDDRVVIKLYASNFGTMASGRVVTLNYNNGTGASFGSSIVFADTIAFKAEPIPATMTQVKVAGTWKLALTHVKHAGTWKQAMSYVRTGGVWKRT